MSNMESIKPDEQFRQYVSNNEVTIKMPIKKAVIWIGPKAEYSYGINLYYKPCWLHRKMMRIFFGFEVELLNENK